MSLSNRSLFLALACTAVLCLSAWDKKEVAAPAEKTVSPAPGTKPEAGQAVAPAAAASAAPARDLDKPRPATYDPHLVPAKGSKPVVINLGGK